MQGALREAQTLIDLATPQAHNACMGTLLAIARKPKPRAPMELLETASLSRNAGLAGDVRGAIEGRQVTIVFEEDWEAACAALGEDVSWILRRANLLVRGIENPKRASVRIQIGDAVFEVTEETAPCSVMHKQHKGLRAALKPDWRGGVSCAVIAGGEIRVGDAVTLLV